MRISASQNRPMLSARGVAAPNAKSTSFVSTTTKHAAVVPYKKNFFRLVLLTVFLCWVSAQCALLVWWKWQSSFLLSSSLHSPKRWINGVLPLEFIVDDDDENQQYRSQQNPHIQRSSTIHCVGETFLNNSWWYKSCHFTHLCFHAIDKEFHVFDDQHDDDTQFLSWRNATTYFYSSTMFGPSHNFQLSPGGILAEEARRISLPWFPRLLPINAAPRFYWRIPSRPILIPFFPRLANNAGHLIWDSWLPIYQLLRMFLLLPEEGDSETTPSSPHIIFHNLRNKGRCRYLDTWCLTHMIHKFLPMLGVLPEHYLDLTKANITLDAAEKSIRRATALIPIATTTAPLTSPYICFDHAVAGLGILTDHGTNQRHGQYLEDYLHPHNAVRGPVFYDFRKWVLSNLHISDRTIARRYHDHHEARRVIPITVSLNSTKDPLRFWNTPAYVKAMQSLQLSSTTTLQVNSVMISHLSAKEQMELAVQSTMFLSVVGGGTVTAMWLPPGASLILFYPVLTKDQMNDIVQAMLQQRKGHRQSDQYLTNVARLTLDWDVWNHLSYIRTHWLPLPSSKQITTTELDGNVTNALVSDPNEEAQSIQLLLQLIRHEAAFL